MRPREFAIATLVFAGVLVLLAMPTLASVVDDAWISARYARNLALGDGLVFDAGRPAVEGYTNLGWTLLLALAYALGIDLHAAMIALGLAGGVLTIVAAAALAAHLAGPDPRARAVALLAPAALALDPHLAVVTTNGLESSLFVAAVVGAAWAALACDRALRGLLAIPAIVLRPEGAAVVAILALADLARRRGHLREPRTWAFAGSGAAALAAVEIFRLATYGALVPNTFAAKASRPILERIAFDLDYLAPDGGFWLLGLAIAVAGAVLAIRADRRDGVPLAAIVFLLVAVAFSVDEWMPGGRLFLTPLALAVCLFAGALARVEHRAARAAAAAFALGIVALPFSTWARYVAIQDEAHSAQPDNDAAHAAALLGEQLPAGAWLVTRDAGVLMYFVGSDVHVAEIHPRALTQPHPDGADLDPASIVPERPELVVLTVERADATEIFYDLDRRVFESLGERYRFLGRVRQHYLRHYDVWCRPDLVDIALPRELLVADPVPPY